MIIRMQESEAAANFQQFLAHLRAGDQVRLERADSGAVTITATRPVASRIDEIEEMQRDYLAANAPVVLTPEVVDILREASADFRSQALEPRSLE